MSAIDQYITLYQQNSAELDANSSAVVNALRPAALQHLQDAHLPRRGDEGYPALSVDEMFAPDFGVNIRRIDFPVDVAHTFRCGVPNVSTLLAVVVNDTFRPTATLERNLPAGVEVGSLRRAPESCIYGSIAPLSDPVVALNSLLLQDGIYIHVSRGIDLQKPIQIVNIFNAVAPIMGLRRVVIDIDDDAYATVLACDHTSLADYDYLNCQVIEIHLGRNARLNYYDLEESSARTRRISQLYARQGHGSTLKINGSTLVGGITRNSYTIGHDAPDCQTLLSGMAIATDSQIVDNATRVMHACEHGHSNQLFKYVLNDHAIGSFYGAIRVDEAAKFTSAYQSNRNLVNSTNARMYTRPQLEIYCDEVKCSHGATIGQLDRQALFYMQTRGIPEAEARLMLTQAFMTDVIDTVEIEQLRQRLQLLIEKRLSGTAALCADCPR